jgi:hypothetical protein
MNREAMTRLEGMRQKDKMLGQNPQQSYKRQIVYTTMPWPLRLIQIGRSDVLLILVLAYAALFIVVVVGLYFLFQWLIGVLL